MKARRKTVPVILLSAGLGLGAVVASQVVSLHEQEVAAGQLASSSTPAARSHETLPVSTVPPVDPTATTIPTPPVTPSSTPTVKSRPTVVYPIVGFSWPAADMTVTVVPMDEATWRAQAGTTGVNPPLDVHNFDPVGHWLQGTGQPGDSYPGPIIAAHTCHVGNYLCNSDTFPFNKLSFAEWAVGQPATMTDSAGQVLKLKLVSRQVVPKGQALPIVRDAGIVQLFTCNVDAPDADITLVGFAIEGI